MNNFNQHKIELDERGFSIIENCFTEDELSEIISVIEEREFDFSERQLLNRFPKLQKSIFENKAFNELFNTICNNDYFLSKAIYFNKPSKSNWFVSFHQDLSISVKNRIENEGYSSWTNKKGQLGVIPPLNVLENSFTFRIHLDKTNEDNGALKVISKSHKKGIIRIDDNFNSRNEGEEVTCNVNRGGVMLMKPLLLHSSQKSISEKDRRVIHLEFCNQDIPMDWLEKKVI
jgi:ectoine hydroxylase-related dioxygenase (phytanoyl-CoA dioxygenase family)